MRVEEKTIEAEVVEIDGVAVEPEVFQKKESRTAGWSDWQKWQGWGGKVRNLDSRFWPLWLALGLIALVFIVAIGMVVAVLAVFYWICRSLLISFASLFDSSYELQRK